jgi:hypothetical protein
MTKDLLKGTPTVTYWSKMAFALNYGLQSFAYNIIAKIISVNRIKF